MAITSASLAFVASERMVNDIDATTGLGGGGRPAPTLIAAAVENSIFPDVMPADRTTGRLQTRLVYPSVLSPDADVLSAMGVAVNGRPADAAVEVCIFDAGQVFESAGARGGQYNSYDAARALGAFDVPIQGVTALATVDAANPNILTGLTGSGLLVGGLAAGDKVQLAHASYGQRKWASVSAVGADTVTFVGAQFAPVGTPNVGVTRHAGVPSTPRPAALGLTTGASASGVTELTLDRLHVRAIPVGATAATPGVVLPLGTAFNGGSYPVFGEGDTVLVQDASNAALSEVAVVSRVDYFASKLVFAAALTNAYSANSKVCRLVNFGDQNAAVVGLPYTQQLWARSFTGAVLGPAITSRYSGPIVLTNEGAITDRWAVVFTGATQFDFISERFGQIASGNTGTDFMPLNPMTNQPFVTLLASGWGTGWQPGNVQRFDTRAAQGPLWVARCISPSVASGATGLALIMRGGVNA